MTHSMKRVILLFGALVAGGALFWFLISGIGWEAIWSALRMFSLLKAAAVIVLTAVFFWVGILRWQAILKGQGHDLSVAALWKVYIGGFSFSFFFPIVPFANEIFRGPQIKKQHDVPIVQGMASVVIDRILEVTSNLFVVIAGGVIFLLLGTSVSYSLKVAGVAGFIILWLTLLTILYIRIFQRKGLLTVFWRGNGKDEMHEAEGEVFEFFAKRDQFFWQGILFSGLRVLVGLMRVWVMILFFGKGLALLPGVTVLGFYYLAILVPIPAAFGWHDALQAIGFETFGLGAGTGAAFALVIRAIEAIFATVGIFFVVHLGIHLSKKLFFRYGK
jgi:uncharacterized protein (TIRG00374 family)